MAELSSAGLLSTNHIDIVTYDTASKLPYLTAIYRESLRFSAPQLQLPRVSDGMTLNGVFIPAGTNISTSASVIGRSTDLYGPTADEFRPERWMDADEGTLKNWGRHNLGWGGGTRKCLGKNIAVMEIFKVAVQVSGQRTNIDGWLVDRCSSLGYLNQSWWRVEMNSGLSCD